MIVANTTTYEAAALVCAGVAVYFDIRERRIPNRLTGLAAVAGLVLHGLSGQWSEFGSAVAAGCVMGCALLVFFLAGGMGAGDVKLAAALGCMMGMSGVKEMLVWTALSGAMLAIAMALLRGAARATLRNVWRIVAHHGEHGLAAHPELNLRNEATLRLPYAVPIAIGAAVAAIPSILRGVVAR